jgi:hypothetical protein
LSGTVNGLDPSTGAMVWLHPHNTDIDMNNSTPGWGADNILFISSAAARQSTSRGPT